MDYKEDIEKLNKESLELMRDNKMDEAEKVSKSALDLARQNNGDAGKEYSESLCIMGEIYIARELYKDAAGLLKEALNILEGRKKSVMDSYTSAMHKYAFALMKNGEIKESIKQYRNVCKYLSRNNKDLNNYSVTLFNLSYAYNEIGCKNLAGKTIMKAMNIRKKMKYEKPFLYAEALHAYAGFCERNKKFARAYYYYKEAAKIRINQNNGMNEDYASSITGAAYTSEILGFYDEARHLYEKVLSIREELNGKDSIEYGVALTNLAFSYDMLRNYNKGRELYYRALEVLEKAGSNDTIEYATVLHNLGCNYQRKEEHARAIQMFEKVLPLRKKLLGENNPDYIFTLQCLTYSYAAVGDVDSAEDMAGYIPKRKTSAWNRISIIIIIILVLIIFLVYIEKFS